MKCGSILEQGTVPYNNGQLKESMNIHTTSAVLIYIIMIHSIYKTSTIILQVEVSKAFRTLPLSLPKENKHNSKSGRGEINSSNLHTHQHCLLPACTLWYLV